jgi:TldD protein
MLTGRLTRRAFIESSTAAALATRLFAAPEGSTKLNPELENLGAVALREAQKLKASYADIRIIRYRQQFLAVRLNPECGTGKILEVPVVSDGGSFGFGVRVIVDGAWGFCRLAAGHQGRNRAHGRRGGGGRARQRGDPLQAA